VAGSGKTTTLAWRIRYLLEQNEDPRRIMVLMYNRHAKQDFQYKLSQICKGLNVHLPEIRTYHASGYRLCRRFVEEGILPHFHGDPLKEHEIQFQLWKLILQFAPVTLHSEMKRSKKELIAQSVDYIELVKSSLLSPQLVFERMGIDIQYRFFIDLFDAFEQWRTKHHHITYSDMLYLPVKALQTNLALIPLVANKVDHVLVDEYQDINEVQHQLLKFIAGERANITVVGDPDQTIYEFRGANPNYILRQFEKDFPDCSVKNLTYSFRYGHVVALLANHLIQHNQNRKNVLCYSHPSTPATAAHLIPTNNEATKIISLIALHRQSGGPLADIAVLFRVWSQSVPIELELLKQGIPYQIEGGRGALFTHEAEGIMAVLELANGALINALPAQRKRLLDQLFHFPHLGVTDSKINQLSQHLAGFEQDWGQELKQMKHADLKSFQQQKLLKTATLLTEITGYIKKTTAFARNPAEKIINDYIQKTDLFGGITSLAMTTNIAEERISTIEGFLHYIATLKLNVNDTLNHLKQLRKQKSPSEELKGIHLSTIHRTKGLEFPVVIIPGLDNQHLPYQKKQGGITFEQLESERRLFYVAITRAIHQLYFLIPDLSDSKFSKTRGSKVSRFIEETHFSDSNQLSIYLNHPDRSNHPNPPSDPGTISTDDLCHQYARHFGATWASPSEHTGKPFTSQTKEIWHYQQVVHQLLGEGVVVSEEGCAFRVRFTDGQTRNFSKETASQYFSLI